MLHIKYSHSPVLDYYACSVSVFSNQSLKKKYMLLFILLMAEGPNQFYPRAFHCDAKLEWVCQIPRGKPSI